MVEVLAQITTQRSQDIAQKGFAFGYEIPQKRIHPLIKPCFEPILLIAEIKRASPSAGQIGAINSPTKLASDYLNGGAGAISVLCEERHFNGSLADLMQVKNAYPKACILRKDFIQYPEEIEISYRAGADMVLLIVAMFIDEDAGFARFKAIYDECLKHGLTPLIEVHNHNEIDFITPLNPVLVGINARNLHTFNINIPAACTLKNALPHSRVIFESAINSPHSAFIVGSFGFDGLLCGSYLVEHNNPSAAITALKSAINLSKKQKVAFYSCVFDKFVKRTKPIIKICGITQLDNALEVAKEQTNGGVDMLGFILVAHSPRYIESKHIKEIAKALQTLYPHILRVAVVNDKPSLNEAKALYEQGHIHAIQLHGLDSKNPQYFANIALKDALFPYYVVQNIAQKADFSPHYEGAFCVVDSKRTQGGGSGKSSEFEVLRSLKESYLCIAGGININNISDFLALKPAMLDINSGIESVAGKKDIAKLRALLQKVASYTSPLKSNK